MGMKRRYFWALLKDGVHLEVAPTEKVQYGYEAGPHDLEWKGFETEEDAVKAYEDHMKEHDRNNTGLFSRGLFLITKYIPE